MTNISYATVNEIYKKLPVGYYLKRNIETELSKTSEDSYFDLIEYKIVISYPTIEYALKNTAEEISSTCLESIIRGLFYHEISHVLCTPKTIFNPCYYKNKKEKDIVNIVEDERIETICSNFYMNVNFKKNIILLNNWHGEPATTADEAFYQLVRYHELNSLDNKWLLRLENLLENYSLIYAESIVDTNYINSITLFYYDFIKEFNKKFNNNVNNKSKEIKQNTSYKNTTNTDDKNTNDSIDINDDTKSKNTFNIDDYLSNKKSFKLSTYGLDIKNQILEKYINKYTDFELQNQLTAIIHKKLKKQKNLGSAINSYSGKLNPRSVVREDYKWWNQNNRQGHIKRFSKIHFNLYIDNSGSFKWNDIKMNKFIHALNNIVNSEFTFDVITINTTICEWPDTHRLFRSIGGTNLSNKIIPIIKRHNKPNTEVYNIVVFDGEAHNDIYSVKDEPFKNFDLNNTIIIADDSNRHYIANANFKKARVELISNKYCETFISVICKLLDRCI